MDDEYCDSEWLEEEWVSEHETIEGIEFAYPGGNSALRVATEDNPRDQPCPNCGREDVLTREDRARHYQCDRCADRDEGRMGGCY